MYKCTNGHNHRYTHRSVLKWPEGQFTHHSSSYSVFLMISNFETEGRYKFKLKILYFFIIYVTMLLMYDGKWIDVTKYNHRTSKLTFLLFSKIFKPKLWQLYTLHMGVNLLTHIVPGRYSTNNCSEVCGTIWWTWNCCFIVDPNTRMYISDPRSWNNEIKQRFY